MRWLFWSSAPDNKAGDGGSGESKQQPPQQQQHQQQQQQPKQPDTPQPPSSSSIDRYPLSPASSSSFRDWLSSKEDWNSVLNATDWVHFIEPRNLIPTLLVTGGILACVRIHRKYLRRIPEAGYIKPTLFRRRSLLGRVTSVGDGDNFRLYHTPGGRLAGWDWLRKVPTTKKALKQETIHVRLAGVDAPELPHFGRPAQPFAHEAHTWLTDFLLGRRVRAYIHRPDQYSRVVATVYVRRWLFLRQDVGLRMLREGLATVYEAKTGVEFGGEALERKYREAERWAKARGKGLWKGHGTGKLEGWESPRDYKTRMAELEMKKDPDSSLSPSDSEKTR